MWAPLGVSSGTAGGGSRRPIPRLLGGGGRGRSRGVFGEAAPPQLSSGAGGSPTKSTGPGGSLQGGPAPAKLPPKPLKTPPLGLREEEGGGVCSAGRDALKRGCPLKKIIIIKAKKKKKERGKI